MPYRDTGGDRSRQRRRHQTAVEPVCVGTLIPTEVSTRGGRHSLEQKWQVEVPRIAKRHHFAHGNGWTMVKDITAFRY